MRITTTAAASLSTSQELGRLQGGVRADAPFVMVLLAGACLTIMPTTWLKSGDGST